MDYRFYISGATNNVERAIVRKELERVVNKDDSITITWSECYAPAKTLHPKVYEIAKLTELLSSVNYVIVNCDRDITKAEAAERKLIDYLEKFFELPVLAYKDGALRPYDDLDAVLVHLSAPKAQDRAFELDKDTADGLVSRYGDNMHDAAEMSKTRSGEVNYVRTNQEKN
jgi:hypothetical protein